MLRLPQGPGSGVRLAAQKTDRPAKGRKAMSRTA
jgi:hypothetical protein